jgi:hypothetical protein
MTGRTTEFRHLILTRFNVRIQQCDPPGAEWLAHRFDLFERFCFPSVRAQTCGNFDWVLFCQPGMPDAMRARIREYSEWKTFQPVYFRSVFEQAMVRAAIADLVRGYSHVITTRLDNDDAICRTFVETLQQNFTGQDFEFLNFTNGYIRERDRLYRGRHESNPFISLVERTEDFSTVYCDNHMDLAQLGPIRQIAEPAAWMQVVHEHNLSNQAWGQPCTSAESLHDIRLFPFHGPQGRLL